MTSRISNGLLTAFGVYVAIGTVAGVWAVFEHVHDSDARRVLGKMSLIEMLTMIGVFQWMWFPLWVWRNDNDGPWRG